MRRRFTIQKTQTFDSSNYLTIEALEDNLTVTFTKNIEYGLDGKNWITLNAGNETQSINIGQTLSFRGELSPNNSNGIGTFTINKKCNLKGNCMSMIFGDNAADNYSLSGKSYAFYKLFYNCRNIVNVSSNFLPATTLAGVCYSSMFQDCTSLTTAPALPATTLANWCYQGMFQGCTKLNYIKCLATDIYASNCTWNWVGNVARTGTFVKNPNMTSWTIGSNGIPRGWTVQNA